MSNNAATYRMHEHTVSLRHGHTDTLVVQLQGTVRKQRKQARTEGGGPSGSYKTPPVPVANKNQNLTIL